MKKTTRRRFAIHAAWALAVVLIGPVSAHAQQMGLFPLQDVRRKRVPCANEDPMYRVVRQEYFGYHPTCWRKFPDGWGCPNPDAMAMTRPAAAGAPTENGTNAGAGANTGTGTGTGEASEAPPPPERDHGSPFDVPKADADTPRDQPPPGPAPAAPPGAARGLRPLGANDAPIRAPRPRQLAMAPSPVELAPPTTGEPPILELPESVPPSTTVIQAGPLPPVADGSISAPMDQPPQTTQAPQRRTMIGGLLGALGIRRR
jgi:hypothetical protein